MKTEILGVKIDNLAMEEVLQKVEGFLKDGQQHYIVLLYSEFIVRADRDEYFRQIINRADLSLCDGRGLFFATKLLGQPLKEQIPGVELVKTISERYPKIFLFGGKKEVVEEAAVILGVNVIGLSDGYEGRDKVINKVNQVQPEILLVNLGMPQQEKWIIDNLEKMPSVKLAIGVGGAFDFVAGRVRRAPQFLRWLGLEWFWRLMLQPWRIKRIFKAVIVFPYLVIRSVF